MKVLVAYERSGVVRRAFQADDHEAYSCDLEPADDYDEDYHYQEDAFDVIAKGWDLVIAHPTCTHLAVSGNRWYSGTQQRQDALRNFMDLVDLLNQHAKAWAIENPVGVVSTAWRKPNQIIQPWQFGHPEAKATCLWLHEIPRLRPTRTLKRPASGRWQNQTPSGQNKLGPSEHRQRLRSITYTGVARAMAKQWGAS